MNRRPMTEEHKAKLHAARDAARARKLAVNAEIIEDTRPARQILKEGIERVTQMYVDQAEAAKPKFAEVDPRDAELEALRERVAEFESKREKAPHEYKIMSGREKVNDPGQIGGAQADVKESLRELIREQLAETFPERQPVRKTERDTVRPNAVMAHDRDGNPVYRKRDQSADPFDIPSDLREPGWDYQWIRTSVYGQEDISNQVNMQEQGWRFVQANRKGWEGRFMPKGYSGAVYKDGLSLVERPATLSEEARREAQQKVRDQSKSQREQFGMALPNGFTGDTPTARAFTFARSGKAEPTPDSLRPELTRAGSMDIDS